MPKRLAWERVLVLLGTVVASIFFWETRALLPFKLLAVMGHETGHAVAALLVGGSVDAVGLSLDEGGHCLSRTPEGFFARTIVYSAGYVGSAVVATVLLVLTFRFRAAPGDARARVRLVDAGGAAVRARRLHARLLPRHGRPLRGGDQVASGVCGGRAQPVHRQLHRALRGHGPQRRPLEPVGARQQRRTAARRFTVLPAVAWAALWTLVSVFIVGLGGWLALHEDDVERRASQRGRSR